MPKGEAMLKSGFYVPNPAGNDINWTPGPRDLVGGFAWASAMVILLFTIAQVQMAVGWHNFAGQAYWYVLLCLYLFRKAKYSCAWYWLAEVIISQPIIERDILALSRTTLRRILEQYARICSKES